MKQRGSFAAPEAYMVGLAVGILLIIVPLEKVKSQQWRWLLVSIGIVTVGVSLLTSVGPSLNRLMQVN